jgi:hypothetical protein
MNKLYLLEQKISTLEIILESIVDELIEQELVNQTTLDTKILEKIKKLNETLREETELEMVSFPYWGEKGEA